jgi:divalent metal cation (Fe/Co/Zn/Cd) transporter
MPSSAKNRCAARIVFSLFLFGQGPGSRSYLAGRYPKAHARAGLAVTAFICHVGYGVTKDVVHRLADGVDPGVGP